MYRYTVFTLLLFISFTSFARILWAQEAAPVDLGEITVMASQPGVDISADKTVIHMDKFNKPGSLTTITDVLTEIGGVDVQRSSSLMAGPGDEVSIRGLNEGRMVIEIDGRRINQTGHMGRYIVDWSTLTMDDVEQIEIIRGGHSVLHPFAIGGVINIITKNKDAGTKKARGHVNAGYGRYNTWNASAAVEGSANDFTDYHFSGGSQETDGYLKNNFQKTKSFNSRLNFHLPSGAGLKLGLKHSEVDYGMPVVNDPNDPNPVVASLYDPSHPLFRRSSDQLRHLNWPQLPGGDTPKWEKQTDYLDAIFTLTAGPGTLKVHGFMTDGRRRTSLYNKAGSFSKDQFTDDRTQGIILEYMDFAPFEGHKFTFGAEYQELGQPSATQAIYKVKSGYIQDIIQIRDRWTLTPGVRYYQVEKATYKSWMEMGYPAQPPGWPFSVNNTGKTETDSDFFPSLKVDYRLTRDTTLYAAASRSYRLPCP